MANRTRKHLTPKHLTPKRAWKAVRRFAQWGVARVLVLVLPAIPYPVLRLLCRGLVGPVTRMLYGKKVRANLEQAFGTQLDAARRETILRAVFVHLAEQTAELISYVRRGHKLLDDKLDDSEGRRVLAEFEAAWSGGWIALTGHIGNWELLGSWFGSHARGGKCVAVAKRMPNARLNALVEDLRRRFGIDTVYRDDAASKPVHVLKSGRALALIPDQDIKSMAGVFVDWFGRPAWTPVGPARLAYAANVPIWGGFLLRDGRRFRLVPMEPIWPDVTQPKDSEVLRMTRAWSAQFESVVRAHPEQWPWYHDRWKTRPKAGGDDAPPLA